MKKKRVLLSILLLLTVSKVQAQPFVEDPNSDYYQYPSQYEGAKGPAMASRAGRTMGITTAEIAAGFLAVAVIVVGAVILTNNSSHQH